MSDIIPFELQIVLIIVAIIVFAFVVHSAVKAKMDARAAVLWISWALGILLIGIFPGITQFGAKLIGIQYAANFVFLLMIFFLFLFTYNIYVEMSKMKKEIKQLNYKIAVLKQKEGKKE